MAGTRYIVEIEFKTKGDLGGGIGGKGGPAGITAGLNSAANTLKDMRRSAGDVGSKLMSVFDGVASKVAGITASMVKWGAAGAIGAAAFGVASLNKGLEQTTISLGAIFSAQGQSSDMNAGLKLASTTIKDMQKDAAKLPGEFSDLLNILTATAIPGFQAGMNVDELRTMASKLMATGVVAGMPLDQVAREAGNLMMGRSGAQNVLGMKLMGLSGEAASAFNKLSAIDRLARMNEELDKYKGSIEHFGGSFEGVTSSFTDNVKLFLQVATAPLFDGVVTAFKDANSWVDKNQDKIAGWTEMIGSNLRYAFQQGQRALEEWWPLFAEFASTAGSRMMVMWERIKPLVVAAGDALRRALEDPNGTIDKLIMFAKLYAGLKIAGGIASGISAAAPFAAAGRMALTGGGAGAAAGGGMMGKLVGAGGLAGLFASKVMPTLTMGMSGFAGVIGAAVTLGAGLLALGGTVAAADQAIKLYNENSFTDADAREEMAQRILDSGKTQEEGLEAARTELGRFREQADEARAALDKFGHDALPTAETAMLEQSLASNEAAAAVLDLAIASREAASGIATLPGALAAKIAQQDKDITQPALRSLTLGTTQMVKEFLAKDDPKGGKAKGKKPPGGGGGTSIQKVEIIVTSNQEPSRIARLVVNEITTLKKHRRSSPDVPNFSSGNPRL